VRKSVQASEQTRKRIEDLISGVKGKAERSELVKLAAQLIIEEALEGEVQAELSREYYARGDSAGQRNGYRRGKLDTPSPEPALLEKERPSGFASARPMVPCEKVSSRAALAAHCSASKRRPDRRSCSKAPSGWRWSANRRSPEPRCCARKRAAPSELPQRR
jgi:hypothetical protein